MNDSNDRLQNLIAKISKNKRIKFVDPKNEKNQNMIIEKNSLTIATQRNGKNGVFDNKNYL